MPISITIPILMLSAVFAASASAGNKQRGPSPRPAAARSTEPADTRFLARAPVRADDPAVRGDLARALARPEQELAEGAVSVALEGESLVVLQDGTEIGRLAGATARDFLARHSSLADALRSAPAAASEQGRPGTLISATDDWRSWGAWKQEVAGGYAVDYLYSGVLVRRNQARAEAFRKFGLLYLGVGGDYVDFKGDLADSVPYASGAGHIGWSLSVGIDFLRYRIASSPFALPEYFWAERDLESKYFARGARDPQVVRILEPGSGAALEHRVEAKAGPFRYAATYAPGAYRAPLHYAALDGLPAGFGSWGLGALFTPSGFIPGLWFRCPDFTVANLKFGDGPRPLRFSPGRLAYFRAQRSQFRLAWSGELALDL